MSITRIDAGGRLGKLERTDAGPYRIPGFFTTVGVLKYVQPDGSIRRELRPPEEAFAAKTLASYKSAPITLNHPPVPRGMLSGPADVAKHGVGHVEGEARVDGKHTAGELIAWRPDALKAIDEGTHTELSIGVKMGRLDETPGVWEGEPYDAVQRDLTINHVALVRRGRAPGAALRLDSADAVSVDLIEETPMEKEVKIRIDGREYLYGSAEHVGHIEAERDSAKKAADTAQARCDALEVELKKAREESSQTRIDGLVKEQLGKLEARKALEASAVKMLGDTFRCDGLSDRDIMIAGIKAADKAFDGSGRSDDYVRARFDVAASAKQSSSLVTEATRTDSAPVVHLDSVAKARADSLNHYRNAWKNQGGSK